MESKQQASESEKAITMQSDNNPYKVIKPAYKIYVLKRIFAINYDEYDGKVVVAISSKAARKLANQRCGDEGPIWNDSAQTICKEIPTTKPMVVLESFNAG